MVEADYNNTRTLLRGGGCGGDKQTHQQTYTPREVQAAFKVLMTHWILQFALRIAFRCVLHRYGSQDIRC